MRIHLDSEANGLLQKSDTGEAADRIWCAVFNQEDGKVWRFYEGADAGGYNGKLSEVKDFIMSCPQDEFVCHNLFGFDLELFRRILGIQYGMDWWVCPTNRIRFTDTLDRSQSQWPDRPHPKGCPYVIPNPVTGKNKRVGPHGLEAWGYRVANAKPAIHDWRNGEIEDYLHRCEEDTIITRETHIYLDNEMERNKLRG